MFSELCRTQLGYEYFIQNIMENTPPSKYCFHTVKISNNLHEFNIFLSHDRRKKELLKFCKIDNFFQRHAYNETLRFCALLTPCLYRVNGVTLKC